MIYGKHRASRVHQPQIATRSIVSWREIGTR